jgi:hypothetical protein
LLLLGASVPFLGSNALDSGAYHIDQRLEFRFMARLHLTVHGGAITVSTQSALVLQTEWLAALPRQCYRKLVQLHVRPNTFQRKGKSGYLLQRVV